MCWFTDFSEVANAKSLAMYAHAVYVYTYGKLIICIISITVLSNEHEVLKYSISERLLPINLQFYLTYVLVHFTDKKFFPSYIRKFKRDRLQSPPHIWLNICAFPQILGNSSSYMTLRPIPSEFTYIGGKSAFIFYQCGTIQYASCLHSS